MIQFALALTLISSGLPIDNGWDTATPTACTSTTSQTLGFPTTPIILAPQPGRFSAAEILQLTFAAGWWNSRGLGTLFCIGCPVRLLNTVFVYPENANSHTWGFVRVQDCILVQSQIVLPVAAQSSDLYGDYVHMLGHALGLAEDSTLDSVLNADVTTSPNLNTNIVGLSLGDYDRLDHAQIY